MMPVRMTLTEGAVLIPPDRPNTFSRPVDGRNGDRTRSIHRRSPPNRRYLDVAAGADLVAAADKALYEGKRLAEGGTRLLRPSRVALLS